MPGNPLDEKAIFNVARTIGSPEARAAYLQQVCGNDVALSERIPYRMLLAEALLRAARYEEAFQLLETVRDTRHPRAQGLLALYHQRTGNPTEARNWYDMAMPGVERELASRRAAPLKRRTRT